MSFRKVVAAGCLAVAVSFLSACATTGSQRIETFGNQLARAKTVTSFKDLPTSALPMDDALMLQLGAEAKDSADAVALRIGDDEPTFVRLFKLADWQAPYSVQVTSFMFGGVGDPAIFYPRYVLLDKQFAVTRQSAIKDFVHRGTGAQGGVSATVFINDENRDEAYLAILGEPRRSVVEHTSLANSATSTALVVPVKGMVLMWLIPVGGNERPKPVRAAAGGPVQVKATLYKPKQIEVRETNFRRP